MRTRSGRRTESPNLPETLGVARQPDVQVDSSVPSLCSHAPKDRGRVRASSGRSPQADGLAHLPADRHELPHGEAQVAVSGSHPRKPCLLVPPHLSPHGFAVPPSFLPTGNKTAITPVEETRYLASFIRWNGWFESTHRNQSMP